MHKFVTPFDNTTTQQYKILCRLLTILMQTKRTHATIERRKWCSRKNFYVWIDIVRWVFLDQAWTQEINE